MKTKLTPVLYLGFTAMDRRFSTAMLPWLLLEIRKPGNRVKLSLAVEGGCLKAYNDNFEPVLVHSLTDIIRRSQVAGSPEQFFYIKWSERDKLLQCYLFSASNVHEVTELFSQMKEPSPGVLSVHSSTSSLGGPITRNVAFQKENGSCEHLPWSNATTSECHLALPLSETRTPLVRSTSNASVLTPAVLSSLSADLSPSDSHFFEVLYIGKVKVSQRKVPDSLIDDALHKLDQHEAEKARQALMRRNSLLSSQATELCSNHGSSENITEKIKPRINFKDSNQKALPSVTLSGTSTTPLEPDKSLLWKSAENLNVQKEGREIDQEFDNFTKERAESGKSHIKRPVPIALEPTVLILNIPSSKNTSPTSKNSLTTLEEEIETHKNDDINTIISDTASSITQFCQESCRKELTPNKESQKDINLSGATSGSEIFLSKETSLKDLTLRKEIFGADLTPSKESSRIHHDLDAIETLKDEPSKMNLTRIESEDSRGSLEEMSRRPKVLLRSKTGLEGRLPENKPFLRDRSASIGTLNLSKTPIAHLIGEQNRTMLFQVGRSELRLISPDRKQILLLKAFKDVASCVLGRGNRDHFGFVCRETNTDGYVCYVFKCESDSIATDVINAIKQAFNAHAEMVKKSRERSPNMTCEHCPMLWYHRLCHDVEGMNDKRTHAFILRRIEQLPEEEQDQLITKYQGGTNHKYEVTEHNAFLMMLLRAHCEAKQLRHVHDTAENRSEFLNQYLGGSTIFMKAKRSLSSGFDHLLKRKVSKDDISHGGQIIIKKESSPLPTQEAPLEATAPALRVSPDSGERSKSVSPGVTVVGQDAPADTSTATSGSGKAVEKQEDEPGTPCSTYGSPMMDIFLKVGDTKTTDETTDDGDEHSAATWRQAIFQRVVSPAAEAGSEEERSPASLLSRATLEKRPGRRSKEQLRELWRMAIDQTILLVRMERENARLKENEESSAVRRIKLEYVEMGGGGAPPVWDTLLSSRDNIHRVEKVDRHMLTQCVRQGVPRVLRGSVWYFLAEQACLRSAPPDAKKFPNYTVPYHTLISGLTKHQHAILIDLGRTFPQHSYFASALGPGQLALYNILKAYSLLDPEVGYCQGLSFVAGILLLHMEEAEAFVLLRHLMFRRGLRKQYLPDMSALQIQLYQLSRLLRDHESELHAKLEQLDIAPALYAAPWMLTLFTSQFPLGFVVRVFDLMFLDSTEVVFAVSLSLLSAHKDGLMLCESCEEAAEYLKHKLPDVDEVIYEKVMKKVFSLDIGRQLAEYAVEYGVLREEMPRIQQLATLQHDYKELERENYRVLAELDSAMESISTYQSSQSRLESQTRSQEQQLGLLSRYLLAHHDKKHDLPPDVKRICYNYNKKVGFGTKINFKFTTNDEEEEDKKSILKTGMSTPNLFAKLSKEEVKDKMNITPEIEKKKTIMKKSLSVNSGLIAVQTAKPPLKPLDETQEHSQYQKSDSIKSDDFIRETLKDIGKKNSGFFANSHELIRQERLFAQQLKHDFDENLKRLDQKLSPNRSYMDNIALFQGHKSMSLNLDNKSDKLRSQNDSGFVTPLSPLDRKFDDKKFDDKKEDSLSVISHPLSDCDVDITFDCHSTQLKSLRPVKNNLDLNNIEIKKPNVT